MKIYCVHILDINEKELGFICSLMDPIKKDRVQKIKRKKDKIRTLIGYILTRILICNELNIKNKQIVFYKNKYGKPCLKNNSNFNFNISHSGDFVVCAIDDRSIGIDIEEVTLIEYKEIAEKYFSINEFNYIVKEDLEFELNKFYDIWTLKESYIKCCGKGLSIPLESFSIDIDKYENINVSSRNEFEKYKFKRFNIAHSYKMAICSLNERIPNTVEMINQNNLIKKYYKTVIEEL